MSKDSKSAATIRRRKTRSGNVKHENQPYPNHNQTKSKRKTTLFDSEYFSENNEDEGYMFDEVIFGPTVVRKILSTEKTLFLGLLMFRICNSLLIQTYYVPDEYWQSLEVAHNMVYGYGYLTWEWKYGLRGYLHPSIFAFVYKVLYILGLDNRLLIIKIPHIFQGMIAAWGDFYLYRLSRKLCDRATANWALFCQIFSWFTFYCATRTLANSTEATLVTAGLYYFPWPGKQNSSTTKFLILVTVSILFRPTAAVIWVLVCTWHLQQNHHRLYTIIKRYVSIGFGLLVISLIIDRFFYGNWVCVQYNFLHFNVIQGGGAHYGVHPWHWYFTQGFIVIMGVHILPFLLGAWQANNKVPLFIVLWTIISYSFLSHKEFRFLFSIMPLCMHLCGVYFKSLCKKPKLRRMKSKKSKPSTDNCERLDTSFSSTESIVSSVESSDSKASTVTQSSTDTVSLSTESSQAEHAAAEVESCISLSEERYEIEVNKCKAKHKANLLKAKVFVIIILMLNIPVALYFSLIHQRGALSVMSYLYTESLERDIDILFLMPCHSTPFYSHMHAKIKMRFLTCEPNLLDVSGYTDEADVFYKDPVGWLKEEYSVSNLPLPTHVVYFDNLMPNISNFLDQRGYRPCGYLFHTHIPEGRVGRYIGLSCR